jgi:hypothetical protein
MTRDSHRDRVCELTEFFDGMVNSGPSCKAKKMQIAYSTLVQVKGKRVI